MNTTLAIGARRITRCVLCLDQSYQRDLLLRAERWTSTQNRGRRPDDHAPVSRSGRRYDLHRDPPGVVRRSSRKALCSHCNLRAAFRSLDYLCTRQSAGPSLGRSRKANVRYATLCRCPSSKHLPTGSPVFSFRSCLPSSLALLSPLQSSSRRRGSTGAELLAPGTSRLRQTTSIRSAA